MKRADIKVGDDLAYKSRSYMPSERVRVIDTTSVNYSKPYGYSSSRNVVDIPLVDGSTIKGSGLYPASERRKANMIVVQRISRRGTPLGEPLIAVRSQTLMGPWAEVHAAEEAAAQRAREQQTREQERKDTNTARAEKLIARLDEEGLKPKWPNSTYDYARGRITMTLDDLAAIVERI